jgi:hypothetical protein
LLSCFIYPPLIHGALNDDMAPHGQTRGKAGAASQKTEHAGSSSKHVLYDCIAFLLGGIRRARRREIFAGEHTQSYTAKRTGTSCRSAAWGWKRLPGSAARPNRPRFNPKD